MPETHTLDVPGARLYYELRGNGPLLLLLGSPMDSTGFAALADALAPSYRVVTYDPRGIGNSTRADPGVDVTPEDQAGDVQHLLSALGAGRVDIFGSSGGATVGLALVTAHPDRVRTLVAHEPPLVELLPDRERVRAQIEDIYDTYRAEGSDKAMHRFFAYTGVRDAQEPGPPPPRWEPPAEQLARMRAATEVFLAHLLRPTSLYHPDIQALLAAPTRIVVGGGLRSKGQLAHRGAAALADRLGTTVVDFPGDHGGFIGHPEEFARVLDQGLDAAH